MINLFSSLFYTHVMWQSQRLRNVSCESIVKRIDLVFLKLAASSFLNKSIHARLVA